MGPVLTSTQNSLYLFLILQQSMALYATISYSICFSVYIESMAYRGYINKSLNLLNN